MLEIKSLMKLELVLLSLVSVYCYCKRQSTQLLKSDVKSLMLAKYSLLMAKRSPQG